MLIFMTDESIYNISSFIKEMFCVCVSKTRENVSQVLSAKFFVLSNQHAKIQLYGIKRREAATPNVLQSIFARLITAKVLLIN